MEEALEQLADLKARAAGVTVEGAPAVQPRLAPGARPATTCCWSRSASPARRSMREESRGGHTRDDYPGDGSRLAHRSTSICRADGDEVSVVKQPLPTDADRSCSRSSSATSWSKYMTEDELTALPEGDALMGYNAKFRVWRGSDAERRAAGLRGRGQRGRGRPRHHPPPPGDPGAGPGRALELQGRQVRVVQRRDQRPPAADVHDADEHLRPRTRPSPSRRCAPSRSSGTWSPTCPSTTRRRGGPVVHAARRASRPATTACSRSTWSAARSSASASSASCARTPAT